MTAAVALSPSSAIDRNNLRAAVDAAIEHLWRTQRADGSWESPCDVGPVSTAQMLVTLHFLGRLDAHDADDAARWLVAQQRADGSFAGHPFADRGDLGVTASAWVALHPVDIGDPPFEDVAGRILHGLGTLGLTLDHPDVQSAVEFLRAQQGPDGRWWGRWINFVVSTSWVLIGLRAVGVKADEDWLQRAVEWLLARQNADGGWGETHRSYRQPDEGGIAPSMPAVTGIVLVALCDLGLRHHPAVVRGAQYLLDQQRNDGTWDNKGFLHTLIPPDTFYYLPPAAHYWPLEGLARVLHDEPPPVSQPILPESMRDEFRDGMRRQGDPVADAAAASLFSGGVAEVNQLLGGLMQSNGPLPRNLPPALTNYFAQTAALPEWADQAQIVTAQRLFAKYGWEVSTSLFCSALPQGYCSGPCSRCMGRTRSLTQAARRRVFETAQFLFDVLDEGGLAAGGRGVRACQTVRLKHALLHNLLTSGHDIEGDGLPVNQEDLQGTLVLFTAAPLDVLRKLGLPVSADEAAAWVHTWAVIGHLLGIDGRLLPQSAAEADVGLMAFRRRHWEATPEGQALAQALVELMQGYYPQPFAQVPVALIRYFSGPRVAKLLDLPKVDWPRMAVELAIWLSGKWAAGDLQSQFQQLAGAMTQHVMKSFFLLQVGSQLNWAELLTEATRALGLVPADVSRGARSPVRHLAYWLMKGVVLVVREGQPAPFRLPAAWETGSAR